jgi:hypothetical protein
VIVTCAVADFVGSSIKVAITVTAAGEGTAAGAVYEPPDVIVPTVALPPATPSTRHVTPELLCAFDTVAVKSSAPLPASRVTQGGDTPTAVGGGGLTSTGHALPPAFDGAEVTVLVAAIEISAESCSPRSSVTVSRTVNEPVTGALTDVVGVMFGPVKTPVPLTTSQK